MLPVGSQPTVSITKDDNYSLVFDFGIPAMTDETQLKDYIQSVCKDYLDSKNTENN